MAAAPQLLWAHRKAPGHATTKQRCKNGWLLTPHASRTTARLDMGCSCQLVLPPVPPVSCPFWLMGCFVPTFRLGWSSLHPRKAPASPLERLPSAVPCSFSRHPHSARPASLACLSRRSRSKWRLIAHSTTLLDARRELVASRSHVISPDSARGSQEACRPAVEPARGPQVVPRTRWAAHYPSAPAEGSARLVARWQVPLTARRERHR